MTVDRFFIVIVFDFGIFDQTFDWNIHPLSSIFLGILLSNLFIAVFMLCFSTYKTENVAAAVFAMVIFVLVGLLCS